jgi:hypothetical protein
MRKLFVFLAFAGLALGVTCAAFITKNQVLTALGWDNPTLLKSISSVQFREVCSATYAISCKLIGEQPHIRTEIEATSAVSSVSYEIRNNSQGNITGFELDCNGPNCPEAPEEGGSCAAGFGTIIAVSPLTDCTCELQVSGDNGQNWVAVNE